MWWSEAYKTTFTSPSLITYEHQDPKQIARIYEAGEQTWRQNQHDMPYINPMSPGGTKYERNLPPPQNVLEMLPIEKQWHKVGIYICNCVNLNVHTVSK